jgi:integrase
MRVIRVKVKGLQLVGGVWRSRKVLPADVATILGKGELFKTTGVAGEKDDVVALAKAHEVALREDHKGYFDKIIAEARAADADPLERLLRREPRLRHASLHEVPDRLMELGEYTDQFVAKPEPKEPVTFDTLVATWELENTNKRTRRTKRRYMARFAEHLGHDDAGKVKPEHFIAFKEKLLKEANDGKIAHKSVENILGGIKAVFSASLDAKKIETNPTAGVGFQAKRSQMRKTLGYTIEQVELILRKGRSQPPEIRFPTLIAAYSGARVGEIADATTHDVYMVGDMWVLDIRTDYREEGQEIKNEMSIRRFPLHPQVIAEGFIDYARSLPAGPLFPAYPLGQDNRRGDAASREISEWIRSLGIEDPSPKLCYKPNHSFRNYTKTHWRNTGVEEETHDAITGHGSTKDESRNYGEYELKLMRKAIETLPNPLAAPL